MEAGERRSSQPETGRWEENQKSTVYWKPSEETTQGGESDQYHKMLLVR